jgi:hypothetical protein
MALRLDRGAVQRQLHRRGQRRAVERSQRQEVGVRVVNETSGAVFDASVTTDMLSNTTFLSPRLFLNNGATADVVAYDCAGVYLETDF